MLWISLKDGFIEPAKVKWIEILRREFASTDGWYVKQLRKRNEMCVSWREPNACECSVIATPIASILWQKKWVMNAVTVPERYAVLVVLQDVLERRRALKIRRIVCV